MCLKVRKCDTTSDDRLVATTTVTVRREGNITAHSKIETKPSGKLKSVPDLYPSAPPISSKLIHLDISCYYPYFFYFFFELFCYQNVGASDEKQKMSSC